MDLDGDGDIDILSATSADDKVAWYDNTDGRGTFGIQKAISTQADGATSVYAADLDGDGDLDVLSASEDFSHVAWYRNTNGRGVFGRQQMIAALARGAQSVYAADLDGDGDLDVISASYHYRGDDKIAWYENSNGRGTFGAQQVITELALGVQYVYAADVDGDSDVDVLSASSDDAKIAWYENRLVGDSNDDGIFDSSDLVAVLAAGRYEDDIPGNTTFDEGDWNQDGDFDSGDLVFALAAGNYDTGAARANALTPAIDWLFSQDEHDKRRRALVA